MLPSFSKKIALRYLWSRRSEAFITIITVISIVGVAVGVMVLNIVMAVMTGFEHELRDKIVNTNSHVVVRRIGGEIEKWEQALAVIKELSGVESVSPFTYQQALLQHEGRSTGLLIRGIMANGSAADQLSQYLVDQSKIEDLFIPPALLSSVDGREQREVTLPGLIIGQELSRNFGIRIGAVVSLLAPGVSSSPFGLMPHYRRFVVVGTYRSGLLEYESGLAYASLPETQLFFRMGQAISGFEVRVDQVDKAPLISRSIVERLGGLSSGFYAQDWTETNRALWDALRLEKRIYFIVLLLIVVMASFSIISTLVMIVLEKRRDIAVLKTLGASTSSVAWIFVLMGAFIGTLGTALGLLAGYLGCVSLRQYGFPLDQRIFPVDTVPVYIDSVNFMVVGVCSVLICLVATIYPARRAAGLEPSDVLRYE